MTFSSFVRSSLRIALLALTVGLIQPAAAQPAAPKKETLNIEQAMRAWQERFATLTGAGQTYGVTNPNDFVYLTWPKNLAGEDPGPYPRNCFYAEEMKSPTEAAHLVQTLATTIANTLNLIGSGGVIQRFDSTSSTLKAPTLARLFRWRIPGSDGYEVRLPSSDPWKADFVPADITAANYSAKFSTLVAHWIANPVNVMWRFNSGLNGIVRNFGVVTAGAVLMDCAECESCLERCRPGEFVFGDDHGLDVRIKLGNGSKASAGVDSPDRSSGSLRIQADTPSAALYTPRALINLIDGRIINSVSGNSAVSPEAFSIFDYTQRDASGLPLLRQIYLPQGLVDIVTDSTGFTLNFYDTANRGTLSGTFYAPTGTPYKAVRIAQDGDLNHLSLTESGAGPTRVANYTYANGAWSGRRGDGIDSSTNLVASAWTTGDGTASGHVRTETRTLLNNTGITVTKTSDQYQIFPWNIDAATALPSVWRNLREELVSTTSDPDVGGKQLTTRYRYYDDVPPADVNYGRVKQVERPDGSWVRYEYAADGRVAKAYSSFNDSVAPAVPAGAPTGDWRLTETVYAASAPQETTTESVRVGVVTTVLSRRFHAVNSNSLLWTAFYDAVATSPDATYGDASNAVTVTRRLKGGYFPGCTERVVRPDNTVTLYTRSYVPATNQTTTTVLDGAPNTTDPMLATNVTAGTRTVTISNPQGQPISEVVTDAASGIQLSNTVYADFDSFGRWRLATYIDGTTSTRTYDCCGLESETDRTGLRTVYGHDSLQRVNRQTVFLGITATTLSDTEFTFDAAGRTLQTIRHSCGTSIDATVPATITVSDNLYNAAGQLTSSTSPRGTTTIDETITAEGTRQVTTTYADLATRIELFDRAGQLESISGTAAAPMKYVQGVDASGAFTQKIKLGDGASAAETEWVKSYRDFAGRPADTVFADGATITREYYAANDSVAGRRGKLKAETRPADSDAVGAIGVRTLFDYNSRGEQEVTAVDLNQDGVIDYSGTDRIAKTVSDVATVTHDSVAYAVQRTNTSVWAADNTDTASAVNVSETTPGGLYSWQTVHGLTTGSVTTLSGNGARTVVTTSPDTTIATQSFIGDRLQFAKAESGVTQLGRTDVQYDGYGRAERMTDARNGATTFTYYNDGLQKTVLSPDPDTARSGPGYDAQTTQFFHDSMGRPTRTILPDAAETYTSYWPTGAPKRTWGARTNPQEMTYDSQGRLKTSATWSAFVDETSFDSTVGKVVTTWNYSPTRGWLDNKRYADNRGPTYEYFPSGALKRRTWARTVGDAALTATYAYNSVGEVTGMDYSDSTPDVTGIVYDRLGRRTDVTDAAGTLTTTSEGLTPLTDDESYAAGSGALAGLAVNRTRDTQLRPYSLDVPLASSVSNIYRDGSRLDTISATVGGTTTDHTYTYQANSNLLDQFVQKSGGATVLTTTKSFDKLNRLSGIASVPSSTSTLIFNYLYNSANQRTRLTEADGKFWNFGYDALGQVTAGVKKLADGTPVLGHSFGYGFDTIGNRSMTTVNGQSATYTPTTNGLNQYDNRTVPAALDVLGTADGGATVAVNLAPAQRQGDLFYKQLPVANTTAAKWQPIDVLAGKAGAGTGGADADTRQSGHLFLAQTPESFTYDFDGNLTGDAQWSYTWDAENRLVSMETQSAAAAAGVPKQKLEFAYDSNGRRIQKKVSNWSGGAYDLASDTRFLYDGWNLLAEFTLPLGTSNLVLQRSYVWGLDLSGSAQGAGGVGGLLAMSAGTATYLPTFDGNGNILGLVNAAAGTLDAQYEYGPFGEPLRATGPAATVNPFGFSTKYTDAETGLLYYGFRYYNTSTGRWLSRDPSEEQGGLNLYAMVGNDPVDYWDLLGLVSKERCAQLMEIYKNILPRDGEQRFTGDNALRDANINGLLGLAAMGTHPKFGSSMYEWSYWVLPDSGNGYVRKGLYTSGLSGKVLMMDVPYYGAEVSPLVQSQDRSAKYSAGHSHSRSIYDGDTFRRAGPGSERFSGENGVPGDKTTADNLGMTTLFLLTPTNGIRAYDPKDKSDVDYLEALGGEYKKDFPDLIECLRCNGFPK